MSDSVGSYMQKAKAAAIKTLVSLAGIGVYVAGIIYAEVHGYSLLARGVDPDMMLWATIGIIALGVTALALPLGLHYSFHDTMQRLAAFAFYALDLGLLVFNAVVDYSFNTGGELPGWLLGYLQFVVPATPIIAAIGWSLLTLLDPAQREMGMIEGLRAGTRAALALRVAEAAKNANITEEVDQAAAELARNVIIQTLGSTTAATRQRQALPAGMVESKVVDQPKRAQLPRRIWGRSPTRQPSEREYHAATPAADAPVNFTDPRQPGADSK